jgi:hypothetical protein
VKVSFPPTFSNSAHGWQNIQGFWLVFNLFSFGKRLLALGYEGLF